MKKRNVFLMLVVFVLGMFAVCFSAKNVKAMEIAEDGEYTLVLSTTWDEDEYIDGKIFKIIRFNLAEDETTVNVSDLTKGVEVFNGKNIFKNCWKRSSSEEIVTELKISDFNGSGELWNGSKAEQYTNGCVLYPKFSDEPLKKEGKYYIILDGFAGKVNGENEVKIVKAADEFNSLDLSEYTAERSGCDFCGWGYDGQQITKLDKSFFKDDDVTVTITALYKSKKFYGVDSKGLLNNPDLPEEERPRSYVLNLDANGGMLENKEIKQYDYLGGGNSGTSMAIFHYIPVKYGYIFKGWNNKKDGRGNYYKYMYWRSWRGREDSEFDLAGKIADSDYYTNLTLYAVWEKNENIPIPKNDTVKNDTIKNDTIPADEKPVKVIVKKSAIRKAVRTKNNKKIKITLKKVAGVKGYQIQYATSKKFTRKTTKTVKVKKNIKTITKLKRKVYYIRVRAYKTVKGKIYYSKWSNVKKVRIKK